MGVERVKGEIEIKVFTNRKHFIFSLPRSLDCPGHLLFTRDGYHRNVRYGRIRLNCC